MRKVAGSVIIDGVIILNEKNIDSMVSSKVNILLDQGFINKDEIVSKVAEEFGVSKQIVRRIIRDMVVDFRRKERVLSKQYDMDM